MVYNYASWDQFGLLFVMDLYTRYFRLNHGVAIIFGKKSRARPIHGGAIAISESP